MQLASARALLTVEQLAGVLTRRSGSGTGLHGRFRDEEASGISAWHKELRTVQETVPTRLLDTSALQHLFRQWLRAPARPGPPPMIMLLTVRFPTQGGLRRIGSALFRVP
jgi:hypothetical protein